MQSTPVPSAALAPSVSPSLSPALTLLLATATGLAVASIYYVQPLLGLLASEFGVGSATVGLLPTLTQLGYGAAILLLSPLGDRFDRRRIIVTKAAALIERVHAKQNGVDGLLAKIPATDTLSARSLALPIGAQVDEGIVGEVCDVIANAKQVA